MSLYFYLFEMFFNSNLSIVISSGLKKLMSEKKVQLLDEKPEMHFQPKVKPVGLPAKMRCIQKPTAISQPAKFHDDLMQRSMQQQFNRNNPFFMDMTVPSEVFSQVMNPYQQQQQQRFIPTNPFEESNINSSNQSFYERNLKFQHQQQLQAIKRDFFNNSAGFSTSGSCSSSSSAYEASLQQQYSMMTPPSSFYSRYEPPPKPDTPPSKPLWLDPVWNCDGNFFDNRGNSGNNSGNYANADSVGFISRIQ